MYIHTQTPIGNALIKYENFKANIDFHTVKIRKKGKQNISFHKFVKENL